MVRRSIYWYLSLRRTKVLVLLISVAIVVFLIEHNLQDTILTVANTKVSQAATERIAQTVVASLGDINYRDLIYTVQDKQGRIVLMQANTIKLSKIAAETTLVLQQKLKEMGTQRFNLPLGQALGSKILASYGPLVKIAVVPLGTVQVKVQDEFAAAGINQTKHRLLLNIESRVKVVIPLASSEVTVATIVPITETVIVGEVPNTYLKFESVQK